MLSSSNESDRVRSSADAAPWGKQRRRALPYLCDLGSRLMVLANHDFCPRFNRYFRFWKRPIGLLIAVDGVAIMLAVFVSPSCWALVAALTAILLVGSVWPWISSRCVRVEMQLGSGVFQEGDEIGVTLRVINRMPWPIHGLVVVFPNEIDAVGEIPLEAGLPLSRLSGWSETSFDFQVRLNQRGVFPRSAPLLVQGFPFGIWFSRRAIDQHQHLIVRPWSTCLGESPSVSRGRYLGRGDGVEGVGDVGAVSGFRDWRDSDIARNIDWIQTARRDRLIVRERSTSSRPVMHLALIDRRTEREVESDIQEESLRWLASVTRTLIQSGWEIRCRRQGCWESLRNPGDWDRWCQTIATSSWEQCVDREPPHLRSGAQGWYWLLSDGRSYRESTSISQCSKHGARLDSLDFLWAGRSEHELSMRVEGDRRGFFYRCWRTLRGEVSRVGA